MGLFITSHLTRNLVPPSVADLIPGTVRTEDFDEESGSLDVAPVIEISRLILSNDLAIRPRSSMSFATRDIQSRQSRNQILK